MNIQSMLEPRFLSLKPSSTLYINETVNKRWREGETVFHLGFGESRFAVHADLKTALIEHAHSKSYLPAQGLPDLCQQVAEYYSDFLGHSITERQVIVGPGSKLLLYGLLKVLNADVLLPVPSWVSYAPQAQLIGRRVIPVASRNHYSYSVSVEQLEQAAKKSTNSNKILILNSPNNPTGEVLSSKELKAIAEYCREHNILVLSDEIYAKVSFDKEDFSSISRFYPEGTIVTTGLSKHLSLGGWRLGICIVPDGEFGQTLMQNLVVFSSETWSGVSSPIQYAALKAYEGSTPVETYIDECTAIHAERSGFLRKSLSKLEIPCSKAQGAFYLMPNFQRWESQLKAKGVETSMQLAKYLLDNYQIATLPAVDFGHHANVLSLRLSTSYVDMEGDDDSKRILDTWRKLENKVDIMDSAHHPNMHALIGQFARFVNDLIGK